MRKTSLALALIGGLLTLASGSVRASSLPVQVTPQTAAVPPASAFAVANGPGDQTDPHVFGTLVTYTSQVNGGSEVRVHDIATGSDTAVPSGGGMDFLSDVGSAGVFYTHLTTESAIGEYDPATGAATLVDPTPGSNRREGRVGGTTLVWQDFDYTGDTRSPEIAVHDLVAGTTTRLTNDTLLDKDPAVSPDGDTVVWTKCQQDGTGCTIWEAQRTAGGWTQGALTTSDDGEAALPDTDGHVVVYSVVRNGDEDVYWQPVGGGTPHELALAGQQTNPNVSNGVIVFEQLDTTTQVPNFDLYAYDIATNTLYRLTQSPQDETLNDVWVSGSRAVTVVWTSAEADYNVYGETFALPAVAASVALSGTGASVTATADAANGAPVEGAAVRFELGGAATGAGSCTTGADGSCTYVFSPPATGTVSVSAYVDTNLDGARDGDEPGATATRDFVADSTPPVVSVDGFANGEQFVVGSPAPVVSCSSSDAGSGIASTTGPVEQRALTANGVGTVTETCSAVDRAGNTASDTKSYRIVYATAPFLAPLQAAPAVNGGHAGRAYPLKWQLADATGDYVSALSAVGSVRYRAVSCSAFDGAAAPVDADTTGASGLRYDATANAYVYTWATPKAAGCYVVSVTLDSGQVLEADFQLS